MSDISVNREEGLSLCGSVKKYKEYRRVHYELTLTSTLGTGVTHALIHAHKHSHTRSQASIARTFDLNLTDIIYGRKPIPFTVIFIDMDIKEFVSNESEMCLISSEKNHNHNNRDYT